MNKQDLKTVEPLLRELGGVHGKCALYFVIAANKCEKAIDIPTEANVKEADISIVQAWKVQREYEANLDRIDQKFETLSKN